jgi:hypothetical protein
MKLLLISLFILVAFYGCESDLSNVKHTGLQPLPDASSVPLDIAIRRGSELFIANCQTCHTARYILMQPKMDRKLWQKIVDKMIHSYGAPIDSTASSEIVEYLLMQQEE